MHFYFKYSRFLNKQIKWFCLKWIIFTDLNIVFTSTITLSALNCSHYTLFKCLLTVGYSWPHIRPLRGGSHHRARPHRDPARGTSLRPLSHPARPHRPEKMFYNPTDSSQMELTSIAESGSVRLVHLTLRKQKCLRCESKQPLTCRASRVSVDVCCIKLFSLGLLVSALALLAVAQAHWGFLSRWLWFCGPSERNISAV